MNRRSLCRRDHVNTGYIPLMEDRGVFGPHNLRAHFLLFHLYGSVELEWQPRREETTYRVVPYPS